MSKKPQAQPEEPNQPKATKSGREPPQSDNSPMGRHSPTPGEDAEWEGRMDELEDERDELHEKEVAQPVMMDSRELASIVQRLEALRATSQELGQEKTRLNVHIEEALSHLHQAVSELAEQAGKLSAREPKDAP